MLFSSSFVITTIITTNNIITMFLSPFHDRKKEKEREKEREEEEGEKKRGRKRREKEEWWSVSSRCVVYFCRCSCAVHVFF